MPGASMHVRSAAMRIHSFAVFAAALTLAGCGADGSGPEPVGAGGVDTISWGSFGATADIDCANGKSLDIGGSNNTLTVAGRCASVSVGGADNTVTLERVDGDLAVPGLNNTVNYKAGEPSIDDSGSGNRINRA